MKKVANFRDFGGHQAGTKRIKKGLLYRSGHLDRVKGDDLEEISSLGIRTVIDLRSSWDIKKKQKHLPFIRTLNFPIGFDKTVYEQVRPILFTSGARKKISDIYISSYHQLVTGQVDLVGKILNLLTDPASYPLVIHCRAGKDRTGFICGIIQKALGVETEHIIDDYLLSNSHYLPYFKKKLRLARILTMGLFPTKNIEYLASVDQRYIQAVFEAVEDQFGGINNYLETCGITESALERIKSIILE